MHSAVFQNGNCSCLCKNGYNHFSLIPILFHSEPIQWHWLLLLKWNLETVSDVMSLTEFVCKITFEWKKFHDLYLGWRLSNNNKIDLCFLRSWIYICVFTRELLLQKGWIKCFAKCTFSRDSNDCLWSVLLLYHVQRFPWEPPPIRGKSQI